MVFMRFMLAALIVLMGLARMRLVIGMITVPGSFLKRDILQEYLMAKAWVSGLNPYLAMNELVNRLIGNFSYYPHPSPYPPVVTILSLPLTWLKLDLLGPAWLLFELIILATIAIMLVFLWKHKADWLWTIVLFFILLAWYPVMNDLLNGQLSILITALLLAALLALKSGRKILVGVLIGITIAIKLITWPLVIYFLFKKDWRTLIACVITTLGLNLAALLAVGIHPFMDYFLRASSEVFKIYHTQILNFSIWSVGFRLFKGMGPLLFLNHFTSRPLINLPGLAPIFSAALMVTFLVVGLVMALRSKHVEIAFAIMVCVTIAISPLSWIHYYVMLIICLVILMKQLADRSFPAYQTLLFSLIVLVLFFFFDMSSQITLLLNGGWAALGSDNQISFASSLIYFLPIICLIGISILLWKSDQDRESTTLNQATPI